MWIIRILVYIIGNKANFCQYISKLCNTNKTSSIFPLSYVIVRVKCIIHTLKRVIAYKQAPQCEAADTLAAAWGVQTATVPHCCCRTVDWLVVCCHSDITRDELWHVRCI